MPKHFLAIVLAVVPMIWMAVSAGAQDTTNVQLGLAAQHMVLATSGGVYIATNYGEVQDYRKEEARFRALLKAGADPSLIRITNFAQAKAAESRDGVRVITGVSAGRIGDVVLVKKDTPSSPFALTLYEYLSVNGLEAACILLKEYERRKGPLSSTKLGGQRRAVGSEKLVTQVDFGSLSPWFGYGGPRPGVQACPDLRHVFYRIEFEGPSYRPGDDYRRTYVVDGKREESWGYYLYSATCSPDGTHIAHQNQRGMYDYVIDGKESEWYYEPLGEISFSPDSRNFMYVARDQKKAFLVTNDGKGKHYDDIAGHSFSPDSRHVAYGAKAGGKWFLVLDGKEGDPLDGISSNAPMFSPDSQHLMYAAKEGNDWYVFLGESRQSVPDNLTDRKVTFSPDGKRFAYSVKAGELWRVVVDGKPYQSYEQVTDLAFSPDSTRIAYHAKSDIRQLIVVDGIEERAYEKIDSAPIFSPDSKHVVYSAGAGQQWCVVVDGNQGKY